MSKFTVPTVVALALCATSLQTGAQACYTLIDKSNNIAIQSQSSPIDLSRPISAEIQSLYPGYHFTISNQNPCPEIDARRPRLEANKLPQAPLDRGPITILPANNLEVSSANFNLSSGGGSSMKIPYSNRTISGHAHTPGRDIQVRSYTRSDGTFVPGHTRARRK